MNRLVFFIPSFLFCSLYGWLPVQLYGQQNSYTGISGFSIPEKNNPAIGFTAFDLQYPLVSTERFTVNGGMRFIGAATGKRGGYFAFGYFSELLARPQKRLQPGINMALLAGGGADAPDKDGWLAQATLFSQYRLKNGLGVRVGLNYAYVSGGAIKGFSPMLGMSWKLRATGSADSLEKRTVFAWNAIYSEIGIGAFRDKSLAFIGAGATWNCGDYLMGDFAIHALANTHGGYMQTVITGGPALSFRGFRLAPALVAGLGGGGGVKTKGGALYGGQLGLVYSGSRFYAGIKYQVVRAFSNEFDYKGVFVSVGKTFASRKTTAIDWELITKAYIGKEGFGNIGARFVGIEYRKFRLMGSTYWAFTHNRGAYAEGLFEATLDAPDAIPLYLVASFGAGAGGGINGRKASLIYAAGIGFASPWKRLPFRLEAACWRGGNIPDWSIALSYRIRK
jgi:hypothetical protein